MAEVAVDERRLLKTIRWWDGFVIGLANPGFLLIGLWGSTLALFSGRPVLGAGLGTYRTAIHLTQSVNNPDELYFAHSDPDRKSTRLNSSHRQ